MGLAPLTCFLSPTVDNQSPFHPPSSVRSAIHVPAVLHRALVWVRGQLPTLDPKDLLPLGIHIQKGAIILGNPSTPSLLVAEFQDALGTYGITPVCDLFNFKCYFEITLNSLDQSATSISKSWGSNFGIP
jgi:hypothetical protein